MSPASESNSAQVPGCWAFPAGRRARRSRPPHAARVEQPCASGNRKTTRVAEPDPILRNWPQSERPTYRAIAQGPAVLTDAELLSVLLRTGTRDESAVDAARRLIHEAGSLREAVSNPNSLSGEQSARLAASIELARRVLRESIRSTSILRSPQAVRDYLRLKLQQLPHEVFMCVFLDAQNRVIADEELFRGTLTQTSVYPREIVKRALEHNAAALIFAHNHPSGVAEPSHADESLTRTLRQALALVDVKVLDHFVVGSGSAMSFAERGLL